MANAFTQFHPHPEIEEAFQAARKRARAQKPTQSSLGSMAEKQSCVLITPDRRLDRESAQREAARMLADPTISLNHVDGPCWALRVKGERTDQPLHTVRVEVQEEQEMGDINLERMESLCRAKLSLPRGQFVQEMRLLAVDYHLDNQVQRTEGQSTTRFHILVNGGPLDYTSSGYLTLEGAEQKMKHMAEQADPDESLEIIGLVKRTLDGQPLSRVQQGVRVCTASFEVTVHESGKSSEPNGWLFFGWSE